MTDNKHPDGRITAEHNETSVLSWLNRFGGLTTRQLARLHWPQMASGMRMAQRTIARLQDHKMVLERRLYTGGCIYVLSERGAIFLRESGVPNVSSRGHRDLKFDKPKHRTIANEFVIDMLLEGYRVWTEFEIQRKLAPVPEIYVKTTVKGESVSRRKIPDAMIERGSSLSWIEVENSWKSRARLEQLMTVADILLSSENGYEISLDGKTANFEKMIFVLPNDHTFHAVHRAIKSPNLSDNCFNRIDLIRVKMSVGMVWHGEILFNKSKSSF